MNVIQTGPIYSDPILVTEVLVGVLLGKLLLYFLPKKFFKKQLEIKNIDWFWLIMSFWGYFIALSICVHIDQVPVGVRWFFPIVLDLATLMFLNALKGERL